MNTEITNNALNDAINFALDDVDGEGLTFLRMWREGDWPGIKNEFPEFDLSNSLAVNALDLQKLADASPEMGQALLENCKTHMVFPDETIEAYKAAYEQVGKQDQKYRSWLEKKNYSDSLEKWSLYTLTGGVMKRGKPEKERT